MAARRTAARLRQKPFVVIAAALLLLVLVLAGSPSQSSSSSSSASWPFSLPATVSPPLALHTASPSSPSSPASSSTSTTLLSLRPRLPDIGVQAPQRTVHRTPPECGAATHVHSGNGDADERITADDDVRGPEALSAQVVAAVLMSEVDGPVLLANVALPRWAYTAGAKPTIGMDAAVTGVVWAAAAAMEAAAEDCGMWHSGATADNRASLLLSSSSLPALSAVVMSEAAEAEHWVGRPEGSGHSQHLVRFRISVEALEGAITRFGANARLCVNLTVRVNETALAAAGPRSSAGGTGACTLVVEYVARFTGVPADLPIGLPNLTAFHALAAAQREQPEHRPELVACYGPLYRVDAEKERHFTRYLVEHIEYSRAIGMQHMVYYVHRNVLERAAIAALLRVYEGAPDLTFIDFSNLTTRSPNYSQHFLINDCLARAKSRFRFVFVGDIDEWLWSPVVNRTLGPGHTVLGDILGLLLRNGSSKYHLEARDDLVVQQSVCERTSAGDTFEAASGRVSAARLGLARSEYAVVTPEAHQRAQSTAADGRTKSVFLSGVTRCADVHFPCGRFDEDPEETRLALCHRCHMHRLGRDVAQGEAIRPGHGAACHPSPRDAERPARARTCRERVGAASPVI